MRATRTRFLVTVVAIASAVAWSAVPATAEVPSPTLIGPIPENAPPGDPSHDYIYFTPKEDLSDFGYVEEEYFVEGTASQYDTPPLATGSVISTGNPYKTRIVVRRPIDGKKANGIILFEWQNVTAGYELDAHWGPSWPHFVQRGYTWIGVSAQRIGVHGFGSPNPALNNGLRDWSPIRYGTLDVTVGGTIVDDSLSYDIYAQAAQAVLNPSGDVDPLAGIKVKKAFAVGASQSAGRLTVYYNSIQPLQQLFDGFYLLVGGGPLRTDLDVKAMRYLSENDLIRGGPDRRQDDSGILRTYEIAGAGHSSFISNEYREPLTIRDFGGIVFPATCDLPPFSKVPGYYVINKQYDLLTTWVRFGIAPPTAEPLEFDELVDPPLLVRDEFGIAVGGIRLPAVEVPIALNSGINSGPSPFCALYGTNQPFDDATLQELYPQHGSYVLGVVKSALDNLLRRYITLTAFFELLTDAAEADVPPQ